MQPRHLKILLTAALVEGGLALGYFLSQPSDPENARLLGFSYLRLGLAAVFLVVLAGLLALTIKAFRDGGFTQRASAGLAGFLEKEGQFGKRLFLAQIGLLLPMVALIEAFLLTWFVFPIPVRPFLLWAVVVAFQLWLTLRILYAEVYRQQTGAWAKIQSGWRAWTPIQKQVLLSLAGLGFVFFLAFIPANLHGLHDDEEVIYPDVVRKLTPGEDFHDTLQHLLVNENWWYGTPFLDVSAVMLIVPKLIFGADFGAHRTLNLLILRQMVSILPLTITLGLLVYLLTGFKSRLKAIGLYAFLLLVPGVVMYGYRFWHPDALVLLTVVLTLMFLQKDAGQYGRHFLFAAVTCGLAIAIKFWGFFFFLTIAVYLLNGLLTKVLSWKKMIVLGLVFILVMGLTVVLTNPSAFIPWSWDMLVNGLRHESIVQAHGYVEPDPGGAYRIGLGPWLKYINIYYMTPVFFFFAFLTLLAGCFLGSQKELSRNLFTWCIVVAVYFIGFVVVKRSHYMMPLTVPLYASAFLFPSLAEGGGAKGWLAFLNRPGTLKIFWAVTILLYGSQFIYNIVTILTSPYIGVFVKP